MPKAKLMSSVKITEEPDGEQFKELLQELHAQKLPPPSDRRLLQQNLPEADIETRYRVNQATLVGARTEQQHYPGRTGILWLLERYYVQSRAMRTQESCPAGWLAEVGL